MSIVCRLSSRILRITARSFTTISTKGKLLASVKPTYYTPIYYKSKKTSGEKGLDINKCDYDLYGKQETPNINCEPVDMKCLGKQSLSVKKCMKPNLFSMCPAALNGCIDTETSKKPEKHSALKRVVIWFIILVLAVFVYTLLFNK